MTVKISSLGVWAQTRNVLFENLAMALEILETAPFSEDLNSDYRQAEDLADGLAKQIYRHALNGLKMLDEEIAQGDQIEKLREASAEAKREADRIKAITKTIEDITKSVDKVTKVVKGLGQIISGGILP